MDVRDAFIEVDCTTGPSWGRTNVDWRGREHFGAPNAKVGLDIDGARFAELRRRAHHSARMTSSSARSRRTAIRSTSSRTARPRRACTSSRAGSDASGAEAAILATPHGTLLDDHFGVVRSARLTEHPNQFVDSTHLYEGDGDPELADACVARAPGCRPAGARPHVRDHRRGRLDDAASTGAPASRSPFSARPGGRRHAVPRLLERRPRPRGRGTRRGDRRSSGSPFIASADHGHGHAARRSVRLQRALAAVRRRRRRTSCGANAPRRARRAGTRQWAKDALADSLWQMLMLHGALGDEFRPSSCRTRRRRTSGCCTAALRSGRSEPRRGEVPRHGAQEAAPPHVPENARAGSRSAAPGSRAAIPHPAAASGARRARARRRGHLHRRRALVRVQRRPGRACRQGSASAPPPTWRRSSSSRSAG